MDEKIRMTVEEWHDDMAIEVALPTSDDFLKIKETLTRIGISTHKDNTNKLYQTCHILQKRGKYYIVHFKELLLLDGKEVNLSNFDVKRRNTIVGFLEEWGLLKIVDASFELHAEKSKASTIKIIPFSEKSKWELIPKYTIGTK